MVWSGLEWSGSVIADEDLQLALRGAGDRIEEPQKCRTRGSSDKKIILSRTPPKLETSD